MGEYIVPDRKNAALLTIGAQNDYTKPGSPYRSSGAAQAVPNMQRLAEGFREIGSPIFHALRLYRPDGSNVDLCRRSAVEEGMRILMPGTMGAELANELRHQDTPRSDPEMLFGGEFQEIGPAEYLFYKPRWGAFHGTGLNRELLARGITTLVICGCNFSTATRATIYEASAHDYRVILATDAVSDVNEDSLRELGRMGVYLMNSDSGLYWLAGEREKNAA
ncbi:MAG: isochorismatase family cysteine hydrolase, partial [Rhodovibrionaceae bacterium]